MELIEIVLAILRTIAPAILALLGALAGSYLARKNARETEVRWRREESMRLLRWAVELTGNNDAATAAMGRVVLGELLEAALLQEADKPLVSAVAAAAQARVESQALTLVSEGPDYDNIQVAS